MSIKKGKEEYHSLEDLIKILKSNKNTIEYDIRAGILKGQYYVADSDLKAFLDRKEKDAERKEKHRVRLQKKQKESEEREKIRIKRDEPTIL